MSIDRSLAGGRGRFRARLSWLILSAGLLMAGRMMALAQSPAPPPAPPPIVVGQPEEVALLTRYLQIDTTNPPGNEIAAARFLAGIFATAGIEHRVLESAPGRGIVWARLPGDGSRRPLILLNHLDVVPHHPEFWTVPAFGGVVRDGFILGRGALDMKSLAIAQLMVMLKLKRRGVVLPRDVIFLGTADEEAGGQLGAAWLVQHHPELLSDAEFLLNEGGGNLVQADGRVLAIGLSAAEKTPVWLKLTATGPAGHASVPRADSAAHRLLRGLNRLLDWAPPLRATPVVEQSFRSFVPLLHGVEAARFASLRESLRDPEFRRQLDGDPGARALLQNTISVTMLEGSSKVNVIAPEATARLDTRLLPGEKPEQWVRQLAEVINDPQITIEPFMAFEGLASPVDTALVDRLREVVTRRFPGAIVTFPVMAGFTDSHYFRRRGVKSYGLSPFVAPADRLGEGHHGNDERIGYQAFIDGVQFYGELVEAIAGDR
jgi:acetylornithine deacetylase/succinyl-diaminopimelate desuccinylase-like protein